MSEISDIYEEPLIYPLQLKMISDDRPIVKGPLSGVGTPVNIIARYELAIIARVAQDPLFTFDLVLQAAEKIISHHNNNVKGKFIKMLTEIGRNFLNENVDLFYTDAQVERFGIKIWEPLHIITVGWILVGPFLKGNARSGILDLQLNQQGTQKVYMINFEKEAYRELMETRRESYKAARLPQDSPPKKWDASNCGQMIKPATVPSKGAPEVYEGNNICQQTAWRINNRIIQLMRAHGRIGEDFQISSKSELLQEYQKVAKHLNKTYFDKDLKVPGEEYKEFVELRNKLNDEKNSLKGRSIAFMGLTNVVARFSHTNQFYFKYTNDFRGRLYPQSIYMSPQGSDLDKAVMEFAEPTEVGPRERYWQEWNLASLIVDADTLGTGDNLLLDKLLPDERVKWVRENWGILSEIAKYPHLHTCWQKWEKPYLGMAQLFEMYYSPNESRQPVSIDATCSGLQFLAAIGKDAIVGKAVNLTATDVREDVYLYVADKIREALKDHEFWSNEKYTEAIWRKLVKRCVMVFGYAGTRRGMQMIVYDDGRPLLKKKFPEDSKASTITWKNASILGGMIYDSLPDILPQPEAIMKFLTTSASRLIRKKLSEGITDPKKLAITFTAPSGFVFNQYYEQFASTDFMFPFGNEVTITKTRRGEAVDTIFRSSIRLSIGMTNDISFNPSAMRSAIAPNFIHSLDAALVVKTAIAMNNKTVLDKASFCHDSFGVSPDRVDELAIVVREQFIDMFKYSDSVLQQYATQNDITRDLFKLTSVDKSTARKKGITNEEMQDNLFGIFDKGLSIGTLDITEVRQNPFFFS